MPVHLDDAVVVRYAVAESFVDAPLARREHGDPFTPPVDVVVQLGHQAGQEALAPVGRRHGNPCDAAGANLGATRHGDFLCVAAGDADHRVAVHRDPEPVEIEHGSSRFLQIVGPRIAERVAVEHEHRLEVVVGRNPDADVPHRASLAT